MVARTKSATAPGTSTMEDAWRNGGEVEVTRAAVLKYAQVIDLTESGRDMKPLITGMFEAIDRLNALEAAVGSSKEATPLKVIMEKARSA